MEQAKNFKTSIQSVRDIPLDKPPIYGSWWTQLLSDGSKDLIGVFIELAVEDTSTIQITDSNLEK